MLRYKISLFLLAILSLPAWTQTVRNNVYQEYFDRYGDIAIQQMKKYQIPASITLAQAVLESGAGRSELAVKGNNHFGIKCNGWKGRRVYHDDDERGECFRAYENAIQSYVDHSVFLSTGKRYSSLFKLKPTDYKGWALGLKRCGYATSSTYASRLIDIIETYQLYKYDTPGVNMHEVMTFNNNVYVVAQRGDTYRSIAEEFGVSYRKLARYNERDADDMLDEGEYVWLKKKRRKAPREYKDFCHVVKPGESIYSISQLYGIRLKYLYKMNNLPPYYIIQVGDRLRVR